MQNEYYFIWSFHGDSFRMWSESAGARRARCFGRMRGDGAGVCGGVMVGPLQRKAGPYDCGQCSECKEWCELGDPCCNAPVFFEGSFYTLEDFLEADEDARGLDVPSRASEVYLDLKREGY